MSHSTRNMSQTQRNWAVNGSFMNKKKTSVTPKMYLNSDPSNGEYVNHTPLLKGNRINLNEDSFSSITKKVKNSGFPALNKI